MLPDVLTLYCYPSSPSGWGPEVRLVVVLHVALVSEPLGADLTFYDQASLGPAPTCLRGSNFRGL